MFLSSPENNGVKRTTENFCNLCTSNFNQVLSRYWKGHFSQDSTIDNRQTHWKKLTGKLTAVGVWKVGITVIRV